MRQLTLSAHDGEVFTGHLPESWAEVPLQAYCRLALAAQPTEGAPPINAFCNEEARQALAALLGIPAEPLHDFTIILALAETEPWLFLGPLPDAEQVAGTLTHQGVTYAHAGDLHDDTAGQLEALLTIQQQVANPLEVAHRLLGVLYKPVGSGKQTAASVAQAGEAFASLPMSVAWPAMAGFFLRSAPLLTPFQKFFTLHAQAEPVVRSLEKMVSPPSASPGRCSNMPHWLLARLIRRVGNQWRMSLPRSVSIAGPRSSKRKKKRGK